MRAPGTFARTALAAGLVVFCTTSAIAQQADRPAVLKGQAASRAAPPAVAEEAPRTIEIAAGEDLWLVDQAAGELVACRLLKTSTVGKRVIRCFERTLPARWRAGD